MESVSKWKPCNFRRLVTLLTFVGGVVTLWMVGSVKGPVRIPAAAPPLDPDVAKAVEHQGWIAEGLRRANYTRVLGPVPVIEKRAKSLFRYKLIPKHRSILFGTVDKFREIVTKANLTWWLAFGAVLGSYRHHAIIPWDDDIDVELPERDKQRLIDACAEVSSDEFLLDTTGLRFKFFSMNGTKKKTGTRVPYLDVFFYEENSTHIWGDLHDPTPLSTIFPLRPRPFNGGMWPMPRDPHTYLTQGLKFKVDDCFTGEFNHMKEWIRPPSIRARVPCAGLVHNFTFVRHSRGPAGAYCQEELLIGSKMLGTFVRSSEGISVC